MKPTSPEKRAVGPRLSSGGEMAERIRAFDWSQTPLGPPEAWPTSLRTVVSLVLTSHFPMLVWWGPELRQIYNDGYAALAGEKHPAALGMRAAEAWSEVWDALGPHADAVLRGQDSRWEDHCRYDIVRHDLGTGGYLAFSYSGIPDDSGSIGGVLVTVVERGAGDDEESVETVAERRDSVFDGRWKEATGAQEGLARGAIDRPYGSLSGAEVVVVSADPVLFTRLEQLLTRQGASVVGAAGTESAIRTIRARRPGLVIAEIESTAGELLQRIRSDGELADLPVLAISSEPFDGARQHGRADDYLLRPFDDRELIARAEATIHLARLRWESDRAVRRSEDHLRLVMDSVPVVVAYVDRDRRLRYFNKKLCEWSGMAAEELQDRTIEEILGQKLYERFRPRIDQVLTGQLVSYEAELPQRYGGMRSIEVNFVPDTMPDGAVAGYVALVYDVSERRRTERQLTDLRDQLANELEGMILLHQVGTSLVQEGDMQALLLRVVEAAVAITGADMGDIQLADESAGTMQFGAQLGFTTGYDEIFSAMRTEAAAWEDALGRGERVIVADVSADAQQIAGTRLEQALLTKGVHSFQSTPLVTRGGRLLGMFSTYHREKHFPSDRDQRLLDLLGRQATDLIERQRSEAHIRRLNEKLEARVSELQALLDVAPVGVFIAQDPRCEFISTNRTGAAMLRLSWPAANASLSGPEAAALPFRVFRDNVEVPPEELPLQRCAREGVEFFGERYDHVFEDGTVLHAQMSVSALRDADGNPRGCVATMVDVTEQIKSDLALQALNARLKSEVADLRRLHEVSTRLMREHDLVVLLEEILDAAMSVSDSEMGTTQLLDGRTGELRLVVWRGFGDDFAEFFETVTSDDAAACGAALDETRRVIIEDVEQHESIRNSKMLDVFRKAGVRSVQSTPLVSRNGSPLGFFSTHWPHPHVPDERELRLLDLLARQAADAIERSNTDTVLRELNVTLEDRVRARTTALEHQRLQLRRLAAELTTAEQRERRRLAALLHDDLQQLLVSAKMTIGAVNRANKVSEMMDACLRTQGLIQESIDAARDMSRQLRPPVLYEDGLMPALEWLGGEMQKKHGLAVLVETDDAAEPDNHDLRALMFEVARELLLNVVKYAGVKHARIDAGSPDGEMLEVTVSDTGSGFDVTKLAAADGGGGFGLFSIRERLAATGGNLKIESGKGAGTTVTASVPLFAESEVDEVYTEPSRTGRKSSGASVPRHGLETRVLVVDDHTVVRQGIASLIDEIPDFVVVGEASDGYEAIERIAEQQPDVVLMDVNMPRMNGIEATRRIHQEWPEVVIVGLSVQEDEATAKSVLEAGATRFMSKASSADEIMVLMREILGDRNEE